MVNGTNQMKDIATLTIFSFTRQRSSVSRASRTRCVHRVSSQQVESEHPVKEDDVLTPAVEF